MISPTDPSDTEIRQGDIWLVSLGKPHVGEPGKNRPAVVVSNDGIQSGSALDLISVVPLTTARAETALRPRLPAQHGLDVECVAVCDGVRALVRSRFLRKIGTLTTPEMNAIMAARALVEAYSPGIT